MSVSGEHPLGSYILNGTLDHVSPATLQALKEALADILACTVAGAQTEAARITRKFACTEWKNGQSSLIAFPGKLRPAGAALVNATSANALDLDDGHRLTKGHPGAVVFPAVLAAAEEERVNGKGFLTALLIGYEVGIRAGIVAHQWRPEYHCTGSWGALGAAAGVANILGLTTSAAEQALGIAEYHSTYSPMMRCIHFPSMVKDAIAWGSMTGVSSVYLAKEGFTGVPSLFSTEPGLEQVHTLGEIHHIQHLYFKTYACCRWAQPAIEGVKEILGEKKMTHQEIDKVVVHTFTESSRLSTKSPQSTEEAQYNLPFPIAAFLVFGEVGPDQVLNKLDDVEILDVMDKIEVQIDNDLDRKFPQKACSRVEILTSKGDLYRSGVVQAKGDYDFPLTATEKREKFMCLMKPWMGERKSGKIFELICELEKVDDIRELTSPLTFSQRLYN
ncbi:2-methylcitrate dehydratase PrpD [Melghirimyces profundicolus]|uniref:2-methylcitrate dehydratase PrpD n=1 Tax=Melghirimyces profundicolus TaxID=1242148 RepID=A0A2T6C809_9BACL|nr:MmgE/PrpD family protein [Melghirimyces profundicolus]PTX64406.1 2-methylcitrate dehydratase PrpD [Melghirimyces profundicolus]